MFSYEFSYKNIWICYLKIDVLCEASVNFQHISQNATPAMEFAPCRHLTQPWQYDSQKTRNTTRLKCCACHENCNASAENVAKDTLPNTSECHEVPRLPCETKQCHMWNLKWPLRLRTVANGCGRLGDVERTHPQPPDPQSGNGNPYYAFGKNMEKHNQRPRSREPNKPKKRTKTKSLSLHSALFWPHQLPNWRIKRGSNQLVELRRPRQEASPL